MNKRAFGIAVCEALGLNPKEVKSINIDIQPNQFGSVKVEMRITDEEKTSELCEVLKKYHLVPMDDSILFCLSKGERAIEPNGN